MVQANRIRVPTESVAISEVLVVRSASRSKPSLVVLHDEVIADAADQNVRCFTLSRAWASRRAYALIEFEVVVF